MLSRSAALLCLLLACVGFSEANYTCRARDFTCISGR